MTGIVEQDELGFEFGIRDSDEPDAEVRIPAAFRGRTRIEEDGAAFPFDERPVAMSEHDQIDIGGGGGPSRFQGSPAVVSMNEKQSARARLDPDAVRKRFDQVERVGVAAHRDSWGYLLQALQRRGVTGVTGVQDKTDIHAAKELDDELERTSRPGRRNMRVSHDPKENWRTDPSPIFRDR